MTQTEQETLAIILLYYYYHKTVGCFVIQDSTFTLLNNCGSNYNTIDSQFNCSCGDSVNSLTIPIPDICNDPIESQKPYCKCLNNTGQKLNLCTNKSIGEPGYVYYTYISNTILTFIPDSVEFSIDLSSPPVNYLKYILIIIGILIGIFIITIITKLIIKHTNRI